MPTTAACYCVQHAFVHAAELTHVASTAACTTPCQLVFCAYNCCILLFTTRLCTCSGCRHMKELWPRYCVFQRNPTSQGRSASRSALSGRRALCFQSNLVRQMELAPLRRGGRHCFLPRLCEGGGGREIEGELEGLGVSAARIFQLEGRHRELPSP